MPPQPSRPMLKSGHFSATGTTKEDTDDDTSSANTNSAVVRGCHFQTTIPHKFFSLGMLEMMVDKMEQYQSHKQAYVGVYWFPVAGFAVRHLFYRVSLSCRGQHFSVDIARMPKPGTFENVE